MFVESVARTNKLWCSDCGKKIKKGEDVIFEIYDGKMESVFCECCSSKYELECIDDEIHPFSEEAFG